MNREELGALLRLLVESGRLTAIEAAGIIRMFDAGILDQSRLPMPLSMLPGALTQAELTVAIRDIAARLPLGTATAFLTRATQSPVAQTVATTPPEVKRFLRERLRNHFRADYERRVASLTRALAEGGDVAIWQEQMQREQRAYIARMYTAGLGRALTTAEVTTVSAEAIRQQSFLYRFAGEVSARRAVGNPLSEAYLQSRAAMYQGSGWEFWHRANETAEVLGDGVGVTVVWDAVDDGNTCGRCHDAANNGPYLPGQHPWPGSDTCLGRGKCRCKLRYVNDMEAWRRLTGQGQRRAA